MSYAVRINIRDNGLYLAYGLQLLDLQKCIVINFLNGFKTVKYPSSLSTCHVALWVRVIKCSVSGDIAFSILVHRRSSQTPAHQISIYLWSSHSFD